MDGCVFVASPSTPDADIRDAYVRLLCPWCANRRKPALADGRGNSRGAQSSWHSAGRSSHVVDPSFASGASGGYGYMDSAFSDSSHMSYGATAYR